VPWAVDSSQHEQTDRRPANRRARLADPGVLTADGELGKAGMAIMMVAMNASPREVFDRLLAALGPQHWWPGETPLEVMVGAVLTQNTAWRNVERAIENLRRSDLLDAHRLATLADDELAELIRPAGYFRVKTRRLKSLMRFVVDRFDGSLEEMFAQPMDELRRELLGVHGIGPETADSILLYAGGLPSFVVDTYTQRILGRHDWIPLDSDYHQTRDFLQDRLPEDVALYNEFHALFVAVGKDYCRKTRPRCAECPLRDLLPEDGPR